MSYRPNPDFVSAVPADQLRERRVYKLGTVSYTDFDGRSLGTETVFAQIEITGRNTYPELTVTGATYYRGMCNSAGQLRETFAQVKNFAEGWTPQLRDKLLAIADAFHLNGLHAGCEHQRALGWEKQGYDAHPSERCPYHFCNYKFGTQWLKEDLPQSVYDFIDNDLAAVPHYAQLPGERTR